MFLENKQKQNNNTILLPEGYGQRLSEFVDGILLLQKETLPNLLTGLLSENKQIFRDSRLIGLVTNLFENYAFIYVNDIDKTKQILIDKKVRKNYTLRVTTSFQQDSINQVALKFVTSEAAKNPEWYYSHDWETCLNNLLVLDLEIMVSNHYPNGGNTSIYACTAKFELISRSGYKKWTEQKSEYVKETRNISRGGFTNQYTRLESKYNAL